MPDGGYSAPGFLFAEQMTDGLSSLFAFFFKYRPAVFARGDFAFGPRVPALVVLALGAVALVLAVRTYGRVRGKSTPFDRAVLLGLRLGALALVLLALLRPMLVLNAAVPQRNYVAVLLDDSKSLRIADVAGAERAQYVRDSLLAPKSALLAALRQRFQVRLFRFGRTVERLDDTATMAFDRPDSHLGEAIEGAQRDLESVPLSGIVVVSDGADNSNTPLADRLATLRAKSVPVFTVGVGAERFEKDIEVRRVEVARSVLQGSTLVADVMIRQRGYRGAAVALTVEDDGRVIESTPVTLPADGDVTPVHVAVRLTEPGARTLTFRIAPQPGEQVSQNNARQAVVVVRKAREKILYVEGEPRYEMRFIREAVSADSNLQLVALLRTAENKFLRLSVDGPNELIGGFPTTRAELFRYRAIVLGSIEASFFTHDQLAMLAEFVNVRGGGLLMLGGRRAFSEGGYAGTPLADVMPIVVEGAATGDSVSFLADLAPQLTPAGTNHAVTQVPSKDKPLAERWRALPALTSVNYVRRVKPGAVTLIAGAVPKNGRAGIPGGRAIDYGQPILVYQRFGRGLAAAMPVQDTWTWRMGASMPVDDKTFETFWRQLLRWMTSDVPTAVTARATTDLVSPKSPVELHAEVLDSAYARVNDAQVVARVTAPSGAQREVPLEWVVDRDGEYRATFTPDEDGLHRVRIESQSKTAGNGADTTYVRAGEISDEFVDAEMRAGLLERIARETGGRFYHAGHTSTLAEDVAMSRRGVTVANELDLWDMPINLLLLVGLLSAEWGYRKLRGLA